MRRFVSVVALTASLAVAVAAPAAMAGTKISVHGSDFGRMLWGPDRQAIYVFDNDPQGESVCYGKCAKAWPPVLTEGRPKGVPGLDEDLLGTTRRKNGDRQVTYADQPLYYYAHEGRGEVLCHDVKLNGGYWWAIGPDGAPRP